MNLPLQCRCVVSSSAWFSSPLVLWETQGRNLYAHPDKRRESEEEAEEEAEEQHKPRSRVHGYVMLGAMVGVGALILLPAIRGASKTSKGGKKAKLKKKGAPSSVAFPGPGAWVKGRS